MAPTGVITSIDANAIGLKKIASGKVREIFEVDEHTLLFVASDRISAYDVILTNVSEVKLRSAPLNSVQEKEKKTQKPPTNFFLFLFTYQLSQGIPNKGALLTQLSAHWFSLINKSYPELPTHLISLSLPSSLNPTTDQQQHHLLQKRSMQVRRIPVIPLESIVRGYITGSAWSEYQKFGTVHGMTMPKGLRESEKLEKPIWTPSTKAEQGEHDENISKEKAQEIVGVEVARKVEEASLRVYGLVSCYFLFLRVFRVFLFVGGQFASMMTIILPPSPSPQKAKEQKKRNKLTPSPPNQARDYAESRGIIIADTKFEFGLDPVSSEIVLIDEVLTPDSSRFWPKDDYEVGRAQSSYDKQYLRDWLTKSGLKGKEGVSMPEEVVLETAKKYREAFEMITGGEWV